MKLQYTVKDWGFAIIDSEFRTIEFYNAATKKERVYNINSNIQEIEFDGIYITIHYPEYRLIFKLEENDCLVGDKFDSNMNHIGEFAAWDFLND